MTDDPIELPDVICYIFTDGGVSFLVSEETFRTLVADVASGEFDPALFYCFYDIHGATQMVRPLAIRGVSRTTREQRFHEAKFARAMKKEHGPEYEEDD